MGTSTSWVAVQGATIEQVARNLGLAPAPSDYVYNDSERCYTASVFGSGWVLLMFRLEDDGVVAERALLQKLSRDHRVVGCDEESHVMYSASSEWREGREVWAVIHDPEQALDHLVTRGDLPPGWTGVRDEWTAKHVEAAKTEVGVDYLYEIPLEVAKLVVGYRLDYDDDDDGQESVTLVSAPSKPWWKFW